MAKPKKKKEHRHDYKLAGMTLYCSCGDSKAVICKHLWTRHERSNIQFDKSGGVIYQTREMHKCSGCGTWCSMNLTTGEVIIHH